MSKAYIKLYRKPVEYGKTAAVKINKRSNKMEDNMQEKMTDEDKEIAKVEARIYTYERTRKREEGIETMIIQSMVKKWIPEYIYSGYEKDNVVNNSSSAERFTIKMYPSIRKAIDKNKKYFGVIRKSISKSIGNARRTFHKRKKLLTDVCSIFGISENGMKELIIDKKIDFLNFDMNVFRNIIKIHNIISNYK